MAPWTHFAVENLLILCILLLVVLVLNVSFVILFVVCLVAVWHLLFDVCRLFAAYCFCCGCGWLVGHVGGSRLLLVPVVVCVSVVVFVLAVMGVVVVVKPLF